MFHLIPQKQLAGVGNRLAAWNETQIALQSVLNNCVFVNFTAQIVSKPGAARSAERLMEPGSAQISINQKDATVRLTDDGLSQVRCNESFPFRRNAAGNEQFLQLLSSRDLV